MTKRYRLPILCLLIGIAMVATMAWAGRVLNGREARALFKGPRVRCERDEEAYYPLCHYQLAHSEDEPSPDLDAITGASVSLRLLSPTIHRERRLSRSLHVVYPPQGALFPPNLCAPFVEWEDGVNDLWQMIVWIEGLSMEWAEIVRERRCRIPEEAWAAIREYGVDRDVSIQVLGVQRTGPQELVHESRVVRLRVSTDPADSYIVYRLVRPPFSGRNTPDTFARHIGSMETRPFLLSRGRYCFNCHMFSSKSGRDGMLSIQSRYLDEGEVPLRTYFGIYDIRRQQGRKIRLPFDVQMTTFTAWSPDGTKLAISADQRVSAVSPIVFETQNVVMPTSDIAVYDVAANQISLLPGASEPDRLAVYPRWTPDGTAIVFSDAAKPGYGQRVKFDLRIVPFGNGQGGEPQDIPGASGNDKSNYFPRFSPNGKWLSFCQCNYGSLIKSSSDVCLMSADLKGPARVLESNVPRAADSWHSWSSNSRWLVFASKRDDGIYARLYFTHIDDAGRASPAVRLPLERPPLASFNIPELVADWPLIAERDLFEAIRVEGPAIDATAVTSH